MFVIFLLPLFYTVDACSTVCHTGTISHAFYSTPTVPDLQRKQTICNVTSSYSPCQIDLHQCLQTVQQDNIIEHYNVISCYNHSTRIFFSNPSDIINKDVIGYIHIINCQLHWSDLELYARAVDLRVVYFDNWIDTFDEEERFRSMSVKDTPNLVPLDMQSIGSILIYNSIQNNGFPRIFSEYKWPLLAEIILQNVNIQSVPDNLNESLPILQSLELPANNISEQINFPWNNNHQYLPLNLSRAFNFNHQYAVNQGFLIPPNLYRRVLVLQNNSISNLENFIFTGCLQKISLANNVITNFSTSTFENVKCLQRLDLSRNKIQTFPVHSFRTLSNLTSLDLSYNEISMTIEPSHFTGLIKLQKIDLSNNCITAIMEQAFFPLQSLADLKLSHNKLKDVPNNAVNSEANHLLKVSFAFNEITNVPHWLFLVRNLQDIDFSSNRIDLDRLLDSIKTLNLLHMIFNNYWGADKYIIIPRPTLNKYVSLQRNLFSSMSINQTDARTSFIFYHILFYFQIDLNQNNIRCDCHSFSMRRYLLLLTGKNNYVHYNNYAENNWRCASPPALKGQLLSRVSLYDFKCEQLNLTDCPESCNCYTRSFDQVVEVDCSHKKLNQIPQNLPENTQVLNMAYNLITKLNKPTGYFRYLKVLDFSHNNLSEISIDFISSLREDVTLSLHHNRISQLPTMIEQHNFNELSLSYNRWLCDCHSLWFKQWLLRNMHQINDIDDVLCYSGNAQGVQVILAQEADFICEVPISITVIKYTAIAVASLLICGISSFIVYRKKGEIKLFLYVHFKWHPFDNNDGDDTDHSYDAFISYANEDYKWVVFRLLSRLESHIPPFKMCLHDRDFEVGAPIQQNITNAIKESRRMIVLLTRNYLQSEWCLFEFEEAHEKVLRDRSNYIIMVLFDDSISPDGVNEHMKIYLQTNTYLSVANKWFWEKLAYAMPKEPLCTLRDDVTFDFPPLSEPSNEYTVNNNVQSSTARSCSLHNSSQSESSDEYQQQDIHEDPQGCTDVTSNRNHSSPNNSHIRCADKDEKEDVCAYTIDNNACLLIARDGDNGADVSKCSIDKSITIEEKEITNGKQIIDNNDNDNVWCFRPQGCLDPLLMHELRLSRASQSQGH